MKSANAHRAARGITTVIIAGVAVVALGVVYFVRGGNVPFARQGSTTVDSPVASPAFNGALANGGRASQTPVTMPNPPWKTCRTRDDHSIVAYPPQYKTPKRGTSACHAFLPHGKRAAQIVVARVPRTSLQNFGKQLERVHQGDLDVTQARDVVNGRPVLRVVTVDPKVQRERISTIFATQEGHDVVTVTSYAPTVSAGDEDGLETMALGIVRA